LSLDIFLITKVKKSKKVEQKKDEKMGDSIIFKCRCGMTLEYRELLKTNGECPNCGEKLVKFNHI